MDWLAACNKKKKKKCTVKYGYWFCMDTSSPWPESNHTHRFIWIVPSLSEQGVHDASSSCGDKSILITNCPYSLRTQGHFLPNWLLSQKPAELEDCNQPDKSNKSCVYGVFLSFFVKTSHLKHLCQWQSTRQFFFLFCFSYINYVLIVILSFRCEFLPAWETWWRVIRRAPVRCRHEWCVVFLCLPLVIVCPYLFQ